MNIDQILLPNNLRGRSIHLYVIPTVCNLKNMIRKLSEVNGDSKQLKQWEKRSYSAYLIEKIKDQLLAASPEERVNLLRRHILELHPTELGASCIDIYLVGYVAETYGPGKEAYMNILRKMGFLKK